MQSSNSMNDRMNKLSIAAVIFLPLTFVSGLGGMNVKIPFQDVDSLWPFFAITAFMLAICACMFCYFRRRNLL